MVRTCDQIKWPLQKVIQGTVPGKRKMERQKKRWEDNIKEWTGLDFNSSLRAAEDGLRLQKIVADASSGALTILLVPGRVRDTSEVTGNNPAIYCTLSAVGLLQHTYCTTSIKMTNGHSHNSLQLELTLAVHRSKCLHRMWRVDINRITKHG